MVQTVGIAPSPAVAEIVRPFINQIAVLPLVVSPHRK
jgi:hypothetical protein